MGDISSRILAFWVKTNVRKNALTRSVWLAISSVGNVYWPVVRELIPVYCEARWLYDF
jgi:hypothetical protein